MEVLKLEKRLDDNLMYLRDALPDYSTVDPEMKPVPFSPTGEVPVNPVRKLCDSYNLRFCLTKLFVLKMHFCVVFRCLC